MAKNGLVISGGGAFGAFGAGTLAALDNDYDVVAGISTGALMSPLVALNEWEILKEAYTSVTQNDIFDNKWYRPAPFKKNGKVNIFAIIYSIIFSKKTFGTTNQLRKLIDKFIDEDIYDEIYESNKQLIVGAQNLREKPSKVHYFNSYENELDDFKDWMWFSANAPFFMSLVEKEWTLNNEKYMGQWTDGGLTELIALDEMFKCGCENIDVIVHREIPRVEFETEKITNSIQNLNCSIEAMRYDIEFEYLMEKSDFYSKNKNAKINLYFLPRKLSNNSLLFDKKVMTQWWNEGYDTAFDETRIIRFGN